MALEDSFIALQDQLRLSEVNGETWETITYNGFNNFHDFYSNMDKYASAFRGDLHRSQDRNKFDLYSDFLTRWQSLRPFFVVYNGDRIYGHRSFRNSSPFSSDELRSFTMPMVEVQYTTFMKIEKEFNRRIEQFKNISFVSERGSSGGRTKKDTPSFVMKNAEKIKRLHRLLNDYNYIADTDYRNFESAFTGKTVSTRIVWNGTIEKLNYLFRQLMKNDLINYCSKNLVIPKCFCYGRKHGESFKVTQFEDTHTPEDRNIDAIIEDLLNYDPNDD